MPTNAVYGYSTSPIYVTSTSFSSVYIGSNGTLSVTAAGGTAIYAIPNIAATISNAGTIAAANGVAISLSSGGTVENSTGGLITGGLFGLEFSNRAAGTVTNSGTILARSSGGVGVFLADGGVVSNGDATHTNALIEAYSTGIRSFSPDVTITNSGSIVTTGTASAGIYLNDGGRVTNGSASDTQALVSGHYWGVKATDIGATIVNYGRIVAASAGIVGGLACAVDLNGSGTVTNGTTADTSASIIEYGASALYIKGSVASQIANFGTIAALGTGGFAIYMRNGGNVTNGAANDTSALISSTNRGLGIGGSNPSNVYNFGTVIGTALVGVNVYAGGTVVNGSQTDTVALIEGGVRHRIARPWRVDGCQLWHDPDHADRRERR
jgi:hypothetical protein